MIKIKDVEKAFQKARTYMNENDAGFDYDNTNYLSLESANQVIKDVSIEAINAVNRAFAIGFMNGVKSIQILSIDEIDTNKAHTYSIEKVFDEWSLLDSRTDLGFYLGYGKSVYIQIGDLLIPANGKEIKLILQ